MKVLILEDDAFSRKYFLNIVERQGIICEAVENGVLGLEIFDNFDPDVVICDIQMPEMDGLQFLETIRRRNSDAIFIMATAFESEEYAIRALELGANNYLKKPVYPENLVRLLQKYQEMVEQHTVFDNLVIRTEKLEFTQFFKSDMRSIPAMIDYLMQYVKEFLEDSEKIGIELGLAELITNAVEHGNLNISYLEKSEALENNRFTELIESRLLNPEITKRTVKIDFKQNSDFFQWIISDEGNGFNWLDVQNPLLTEGIEKLHGRGIFISRFQFDEMEYLEKGNVVRILKKIVRKMENR
jgi:YesN/AraC family two-component response regulator